MRWLLDTSVLIDAVRRSPSAVATRLASMSPDDLAISVVTIAELWYGVARSSDPEKKRSLWLRFLEPFETIPFDRSEAGLHGELRHALRHQPIGERDLFIAATALANGLVVVTGNVREFARVPGLSVETWVEAR